MFVIYKKLIFNSILYTITGISIQQNMAGLLGYQKP